MSLSKQVSFIFKAITVGLAAAFVIVFLRPDLLQPRQKVVEVHQDSHPSTPAPAAAPTGATSRRLTFAPAVEAATPAVVNIFTRKVVREQRNPLLDDPLLRRFFGDALPAPRARMQNSLGSGVIVSKDGYILTNFHVIQGADEVLVSLRDGRTAGAAVVGSDPETDLAVLKINLGTLPSITLGDSQSLRVGDLVLAIGDPFGVGQTVTMGIISATGRNQLGINTFEDFIQTDAAINPGNSGGALVNLYGELIGINTAIASRTGGSQGIGFAIPAQLASGVMRQIIEKGRVVRGWLGIQAQDLTPELAQSLGVKATSGVLVTGLLRDGPAYRAGIQPGDLVTAVDGRAVTNSREVLDIVARRQPGSRMTVEGVRGAKHFTVQVTIAERPRTQPQ